MDDGRINKKIYKCAALNKGPSCKNSTYRLSKKFEESGIGYMFEVVDSNAISKRFVRAEIQGRVRNETIEKWQQELSRNSARRGEGENKLRSYRAFKTEYKTENDLTCLLSRRHRSAFSKFRCGVAPLRLETERYENLQVNDSLFCSDQSVETEIHVLLNCPLYDDLRQAIVDNIFMHYDHFNTLDELEKLTVILGSDNYNVIKFCAKTSRDILDRRRGFLHQ